MFIRVHSCSFVFHSCSLVFTRVHSCSTRVHSCSLVFIRVPLVFTRVHSCSFVFIRVHSCSDLCGVLDMIVQFPPKTHSSLFHYDQLSLINVVRYFYTCTVLTLAIMIFVHFPSDLTKLLPNYVFLDCIKISEKKDI